MPLVTRKKFRKQQHAKEKGVPSLLGKSHSFDELGEGFRGHGRFTEKLPERRAPSTVDYDKIPSRLHAETIAQRTKKKVTHSKQRAKSKIDPDEVDWSFLVGAHYTNPTQMVRSRIAKTPKSKLRPLNQEKTKALLNQLKKKEAMIFLMNQKNYGKKGKPVQRERAYNGFSRQEDGNIPVENEENHPGVKEYMETHGAYRQQENSVILKKKTRPHPRQHEKSRRKKRRRKKPTQENAEGEADPSKHFRHNKLFPRIMPKKTLLRSPERFADATYNNSAQSFYTTIQELSANLDNKNAYKKLYDYNLDLIPAIESMQAKKKMIYSQNYKNFKPTGKQLTAYRHFVNYNLFLNHLENTGTQQSTV